MSEKVLRVVAKTLDVPLESVSEETGAETLAAWDSLRQMQLVFALEEAFGVTFEDDEIPQLVGVRNVLALLRAKGAAVD